MVDGCGDGFQFLVDIETREVSYAVFFGDHRTVTHNKNGPGAEKICGAKGDLA